MHVLETRVIKTKTQTSGQSPAKECTSQSTIAGNKSTDGVREEDWKREREICQRGECAGCDDGAVYVTRGEMLLR